MGPHEIARGMSCSRKECCQGATSGEEVRQADLAER